MFWRVSFSISQVGRVGLITAAVVYVSIGGTVKLLYSFGGSNPSLATLFPAFPAMQSVGLLYKKCFECSGVVPAKAQNIHCGILSNRLAYCKVV